jgi:endonuclease/exonuclease/phosphatase family metal-dependent hydrolase
MLLLKVRATSFSKKFTMRFILPLLLVFILNILSPIQSISAQEIKVMTYNIYHGEHFYSLGTSNLEEIAEIINEYKPDFVALQEVDSMTDRTASIHNNIPQDLVKVLAEKTNMYGYFGKAIDYSSGGYGEGILSRFPVKAVNRHLPCPKGGEGRALLMVEHNFSNGSKLIFGGTHLCHEFPENRIAQSKEICDILNNHTLPIIIGGDFNFRPETEPYKIITKCLNDAAVLEGNPKNTHSYKNPKARIDYIFVSKKHNWIIKSVEVIPVYPSDHMPVLITLELQE